MFKVLEESNQAFENKTSFSSEPQWFVCAFDLFSVVISLKLIILSQKKNKNKWLLKGSN